MILDNEPQRKMLLGILDTVTLRGNESAEMFLQLVNAVKEATVPEPPKPSLWRRIRGDI